MILIHLLFYHKLSPFSWNVRYIFVERLSPFRERSQETLANVAS